MSPHLEWFLPPVCDNIQPQTYGAGKKPKVSYKIFAKAFAYGLSSGSTLANMTPVNNGTMMPPTNRKSHNKIINKPKLLTNGDGAATPNAIEQRTRQSGIAFFDSYPPIH